MKESLVDWSSGMSGVSMELRYLAIDCNCKSISMRIFVVVDAVVLLHVSCVT